ncbi:hypothetical protein B566_EDAN009386 [Ephemera danica]|nr:hypothetical protein B566_EDAN009386 [Ephemera danica]
MVTTNVDIENETAMSRMSAMCPRRQTATGASCRKSSQHREFPVHTMRQLVLTIAVVALTLPGLHCYGPPAKGKKPVNVQPNTDSGCGPSCGGVDSGCGSSGCGSAPIHQGSAPIDQGCGPSGCGSAPIHQGSAPIDQGCGPSGCGSAPIGQGCGPSGCGSAPIDQGRAPIGQQPSYQGTTPVHQGSGNAGTPNYSQNPFLNGGIVMSGLPPPQSKPVGSNNIEHGGNKPDYSTNPFLQGGSVSQTTCTGAGCSQGPDYSNNPFLSGGASPQKPVNTGFNPQQPANTGYPQQPANSGYNPSGQGNAPVGSGGIVCNTGFICVHKRVCHNGFVNQNDANPSKPQGSLCDVNGAETCCSVTSRNDAAPGLVHVQPQPGTSPGLIHVNPSQPAPGIIGGGNPAGTGIRCYDGTYCEVMERCDNDKMAQPKATCNLVQQGGVGVCCLRSGTPINTVFTRPPAHQGSQNQGNFQRPPPQSGFANKPDTANFPQQQQLPQQNFPKPAPQPGFQPQPQQPGFQQPKPQPGFQQQPQQPGFQQPKPQPGFQQQPQQPGFQQPKPQPGFQQQPQQPGFQQPKPQPGFQQQPQQPGFQQPKPQPGFQQPQQPGFQQPHQPGFQQQQPKPQQPGFQQPQHPKPQQPGFQQPNEQPSGFQEQPAFQPQPAPIDKIDSSPPVFVEGTHRPEQPQNPSHTQFFQTQAPTGGYNRPQSQKKPIQHQPEQSVIHQTPLLPPQYPQLSQQASPGQLCGVRRVSQFSGLQGEDGQSVPGEFPWLTLVSLPSNNTRLCAGALISNKAVLTSAHCTASVAAIARHPSFEAGSLSSDLAVLLLGAPLQLGRHVDLVCLPEPSQLGKDGELINPGGACVMSSWPKQAGAEGYLHRLAMSFVPKEKCEDSLRQTYLGKYFQLNKSFMCAKPLDPQRDLCTVGLGGPLVCPQQDGRYVVTGASSWDVGCSERRAPSVLCAVDVNWVHEVLARPVEDFVSQQTEERVDHVAPEYV